MLLKLLRSILTLRMVIGLIRDRVRVYSGGGSPQKEKFRARYDELGRVELVPDGVDDLYAYIQSFKDSVDIHVIIDRFARGDVAALSQRQGIYADVTGMPRTYADLLNVVNDLEYKFNALPSDVRE